MKVDAYKCDVCGDEITRSEMWAKFKRKWRMRAYKWAICNLAPVDAGWVQSRIDLCESCWRDVLEEVKERVNDD